jgi:hypothetical protein
MSVKVDLRSAKTQIIKWESGNNLKPMKVFLLCIKLKGEEMSWIYLEMEHWNWNSLGPLPETLKFLNHFKPQGVSNYVGF